MNFIKYKAVTNAKKTKNKGGLKKAMNKPQKGIKKSTRYTRQFAVNLTKSMAAVKALLKVKKTALTRGIKLTKTSG